MARFVRSLLVLPLVLAVLAVAPSSAPSAGADPVINGPVFFHRWVDGRYQIHRADIDGANVQQITFVDKVIGPPAVSADATRIAYTAGNQTPSSSLYTVGSSGANTQLIYPSFASGPTWSPDGTKIAFRGSGGIFSINSTGGGLTQLTVDPVGVSPDAQPLWSPDGTKIAFQRDNANGSPNVWVMDADGTDETAVTTSDFFKFPRDWSPDSSKILYAQSNRLYTVTPAGTGTTQLTTHSADVQGNASYSPDGTKIVYARSSPDEFWTMNADGTGAAVAFANDGRHPDWATPPPCLPPFSDVPMWVEDSVEWAYCEELMGGYPDLTFRPNLNISRAQVANLLYNVAGRPDVSGQPPHGLSDVPAWVEDAVRWLVGEGHAGGYPDGTFKPNLPITRGQLARMQFRIAGSPPGSPPHGFSDVPDWVNEAVKWLVDPANDPRYSEGYPDNTFRPNLDITRAQVTRMACRIVGTAAC